MNVQYGKSVQDQERFRNTTVFTDPWKFARKAASANMLDMHIQIAENGGFLGLVDTAKKKGAVLRSVPQVGLKTLEEAHLMIFLNHYDVRKVFDGPLLLNTDLDPDSSSLRPLESRVRLLKTDTDSNCYQLFTDEDPYHALAASNFDPKQSCFIDLVGDEKTEKAALGRLSILRQLGAAAGALREAGQRGRDGLP